MQIALFLHLYQPPTQLPRWVEAITRQSYEKIVGLLEEYPKARVTVNMSASLTKQLDSAGFGELLGRISGLAEDGQIEFTESAAYHPILPDIPKREIVRQINLNSKINQSYFGSAYKPTGFFPPELAYSDSVGDVVQELGYRWMLVDATAVEDWRKYLSFVYRLETGKLLLFPREDSLSWRIAFGRIRTRLGLMRAIGAEQLARRQYVVLAMDGETFGHHQPRQLHFLRQLFEMTQMGSRMRLATMSELIKLYPKRKAVRVRTSTWGYTELHDGEPVWVRWRNPRNPLHRDLNRLRELAISSVRTEDSEARALLDQALASDTYWWASGKPFWHPGMVKRGAELFCSAVLRSRSATREQRNTAQRLCFREIPEEFQKLRTRKQRLRILEDIVSELKPEPSRKANL